MQPPSDAIASDSRLYSLRRCPRCGKALPATEKFFYPSKSNNSGLSCYCRPCTILSVRSSQQRRKETLPASCYPGTHKECRRCHQLKPKNTNYFPPSAVGADGLYPWCRVCKLEYMRDYRKRKKAEREKGKGN